MPRGDAHGRHDSDVRRWPSFCPQLYFHHYLQPRPLILNRGRSYSARKATMLPQTPVLRILVRTARPGDGRRGNGNVYVSANRSRVTSMSFNHRLRRSSVSLFQWPSSLISHSLLMWGNTKLRSSWDAQGDFAACYRKGHRSHQGHAQRQKQLCGY